MGTHGKSNLRHQVFGSNAMKATREVCAPVLTIPFDATFKPLRSVVFATDREHEARAVFAQWEVLSAMIYKFRPTLTSLFIADPDEATAHPARTLAMPGKSPITVQYDNTEVTEYNENVGEGIKKYILRHNADMLVMVAHELPWIARMFHHSVTQELLMDNLLPVLVLHEKKR
jgi:nucleotide-binding universal stress UspA family protein